MDLWWSQSVQAHVTHTPSRLSAWRHHCVTCSQDFLLFLSPLWGITAPERPCQFPHCLLHAASVQGGWAMTFEEILDQATAMLQRRGRVSYRMLTLQFHLDEASLAALKEELIEVHHLAVDQDGRMLVWRGEGHTTSVASSPQPL